MTCSNTSGILDQRLLAVAGLPTNNRPDELEVEARRDQQRIYAQKLYNQQQQQAASVPFAAPTEGRSIDRQQIIMSPQVPLRLSFFDPGEEDPMAWRLGARQAEKFAKKGDGEIQKIGLEGGVEGHDSAKEDGSAVQRNSIAGATNEQGQQHQLAHLPNAVSNLHPQQALPSGLASLLQLRHGVFFSKVISRGLLIDFLQRSTYLLPPRAIPVICRILDNSNPPIVSIDVLERETWLYFWDLDDNMVKKLQQDWVMLLGLVPDWMDLMPGDVRRAYHAAVDGV